MTPSIPQSNPKASYEENAQSFLETTKRVFEKGWFIQGEELAAFEKEFANYHHENMGAVGVANGTDADELALRAVGVGSENLVFTVAHTAVATVAAIIRTGATPVLVDIDPISYTMDPESLERTILHQRSRGKGIPKAVVVVHLYGQVAKMDQIIAITQKHGLSLIEDCAQAHGAGIDGKMAGTFGDAGAFSFYPTKNLGAFGDGGAVISNNPTICEKIKMLREYGWRDRYISREIGFNSRLDELQAAFLRIKLRTLDSSNKSRARIAEQYSKEIVNSALSLPSVTERTKHVFHQYVVRSMKRDELAIHLKNQGIGSLIHYPVPVHLQPAYKAQLETDPSGMIHTERAACEVLSLPMFPQMTEGQVARVVEAVNSWGK